MDEDRFKKLIESASSETGFRQDLIEKDYYLTILLNDINSGLDENLVFKGGTCLNKIYYDYFRLSEDLDFSMKLPDMKMNKKKRSRHMEKIKNSIEEYVQERGLKLNKDEKAGRNESKQYIFYLEYGSVVTGAAGRIKIEIGLRANPVIPPANSSVKHIFKDPFTGENVLKNGKVFCLQLKEMAAEKFRAAATRDIPAPRDFYDLYYYIKNGFDFSNREVIELIDIKLKEGGCEGKRKEYFLNINKTEKQVKELEGRVKTELFPVLREKDIKVFSLKKVFDYFKGLV